MALPTCPKCDSHLFSLSELHFSNANHRYQAVVCSMCGCIITVLPFTHTNSLIRELAANLGRPLAG
jgi:hypothetical protein